jgi:excisionase family DNA binding protein
LFSFAYVITTHRNGHSIFKNFKILRMENLQLDERLRNIESLLLSQKTVLTFDEVARYTGLSKSFLYKLTSSGEIPHYKPQGKHIFCNKAEIDLWLQRNPTRPLNAEELEERASTYVTLKNMGVEGSSK